MTEEELKKHPIIIFDGVCNFCDATVNFILKKDKNKKFLFIPSQSPAGEKLLSWFNAQDLSVTTVFLYEDEVLYKKSTAALRIARQLPFPYKLLYFFKIIPVSLRDNIYMFISRNRYKWFGKKDYCILPAKEERERFVEDFD
jgi:predicted DCC family thiol-disulfide oxidoreductase YuxK